MAAQYQPRSVKERVIFPSSVLSTHFATQGASSSGLLFNARVCASSVSLLTLPLFTLLPHDSLAGCWPPQSQSHSVFCFVLFCLFSPPTVCRPQAGRLSFATHSGQTPAGMRVCVASAAVSTTNMLAGKPWCLKSCFLSDLKGCYSWCVGCTPLDSPSSVTPPLSTKYWFDFFLVSETGMSTLTSSLHSCLNAVSGRCRQSH